MLENKRLNMILSLLIAIALWAFVIGEVNPAATRTYREIPIQLMNEDALDDSGLAVYSISDTVLSVTVTGTRSEVNQINTKDIIATVDLDQASIGENQLRVDVRVPSKVDIEAQSINKVTVVVEEKVEKDVEIRVRYNGSFEAEKEPITVEQSDKYVTVTGAASNVSKVAHVNAIVSPDTVGEELSTFDCPLVPVNDSDVQVYNVELMKGSITVTAELATTKTVPLTVPITEKKNADIVRTVTVPETIILKGRRADLDAIDSVTAKAIDISNVMENKTIDIVPILPDNIEISSENEALLVMIQVVRMKSKELTFTADDIAFINLDENLKAVSKTNNIQVTIIGGTDILNSVSMDNFVLSADLSGLSEGRHTVPLDVQCSVSTLEVEYKPVKITVNIEADEEGDSGDNAEDDGGNTDEEQQDNQIDEGNIEE